MTRILLKARPTETQLRDRLAEPVPEGLELYLDRQDLAGADYLARITATIQRQATPTAFTWIVEAPTRTLDGHYFDLTSNTEDSRETLRRVAAVGKAIGAVAANVHVVAPTTETADLTASERARKLVAAGPLLEFYLERCAAAGLVPQVENIPPVGRMREAAYVFSSIGSAASDLVELAERFPPLRFTVDVSHAALTQNWRADGPIDVEPGLRPVAEFCRLSPGARSLADYVAQLADRTTTVHVSNADGLLGEGLGYGEGPEDLDAVLGTVVGWVPYVVTETLEADDTRAVGMRDAQQRLRRLREFAVVPIGGST